MKLAHIADLHVRGLTCHDEMRTIVEAFCSSAKNDKVDHVVIAGDIWHSKCSGLTPEAVDFMTWMFREFAKVARVHVTLGNHDGVLTNMSRQDAISPIIAAINDPNITLYKNSGVFQIEPGVNLCVYSLFDREGWPAVAIVPGEYNIAVYHGSVGGAVSEDGWLLKSDVTVQWFEDKGFDIVLLGDIHRQQYLGYRDYK